MRLQKQKIKIGIVGCGAIGSGIARSIVKDFKKNCLLTALFDIDQEKSSQLAKKLSSNRITKSSLSETIKKCDLMVESVNAENTHRIILEAVKGKRNVLAMSVGKLLNADSLFRLAQRNNCTILLPSGAIAGIDAIKAASLVKIHKITLTTRKPPSSFLNNAYIMKKGVDLEKLKKETILFEGDVDTAVECFPQNVNVAATLALASHAKEKIFVRILTSPTYTTNTHEIEMEGEFGRLYTRTENVVSPDNPKTSYLAVLSGIQTLKQFCEGIMVGT
ncbi:MAG TPA: aspartate dehydrogenase [Candidatus Omnitrophica bacterium]|nr:aspartate dehydrogenase [Candidatus Omnitrophota bacterium]